jgi:hypothetical protein
VGEATLLKTFGAFMSWSDFMPASVSTKPVAEYRGNPAYRGVESWRYDRMTVSEPANTFQPYEDPKEGDCYVDDGA